MAKRRKLRSGRFSALGGTYKAPPADSVAGKRIALLNSDKPDPAAFDTQIKELVAHEHIAGVMKLPPTCAFAACRRHRRCRFDWGSPTLPPADTKVWNGMEDGLPYCVAHHIDAFMHYMNFARAMAGQDTTPWPPVKCECDKG